MRRLMLAIAVAAPVSLHAEEPQWLWVDKTVDEETISIDVNSMRANGKIITAWFKTERGKPSKKDRVAYEKTRIRFDCASDRSEVLSLTKYDVGGRVIDSVRSNIPNDWRDVVPGSVGQGMYEYACALIQK